MERFAFRLDKGVLDAARRLRRVRRALRLPARWNDTLSDAIHRDLDRLSTDAHRRGIDPNRPPEPHRRPSFEFVPFLPRARARAKVKNS